MPTPASNAGEIRSPLLPESAPASAPGGTDGAEASSASVTGAVFNVSTSIIGAGIMSIPATLKVLGVLPALAAIAVVALLCDVSVEFMLRYTTGRPARSSSYAGVMEESFGKAGSTAVRAFVVLNNFGVLIVYLNIIGDVLSGTVSQDGTVHWGVLQEWSGGLYWWNGRAVAILFIVLFVLFPLLFLRRLDSLRYSSALAVLLAVVFVAISSGVAIYALIRGQTKSPRLFPDFTTVSSFELFTAIPVIVLAFTFHFNVYPIRAEMSKTSEMTRAVRISLVLCSAVYAAVGFFGYLLFGDSTLSDVLANFDRSSGYVLGPFLNDLVRVSYALHLVLVFPLLFFSMRLNIDGLLFEKARRPLAYEPVRFAWLTTVLAATVYAAAIAIPDIWFVFQIFGSTVAVSLSLIFPALIVLRDVLGISKVNDKIIAGVMIVLAMATSAIAITSNIISFMK